MLNETLDLSDFEPVELQCMRCGKSYRARFVGACPACAGELHDKYRGEARDIEAAEYVPKMNVTPNAVALKE